MDNLKINPTNGETYAFCYLQLNTISTLQWVHGAFRYTKLPKSYGSYLWPKESLGAAIKITQSEFEFLLGYEKMKAHLYEKR
jgi:hypothetical protein